MYQGPATGFKRTKPRSGHFLNFSFSTSGLGETRSSGGADGDEKGGMKEEEKAEQDTGSPLPERADPARCNSTPGPPALKAQGRAT